MSCVSDTTAFIFSLGRIPLVDTNSKIYKTDTQNDYTEKIERKFSISQCGNSRTTVWKFQDISVIQILREIGTYLHPAVLKVPFLPLLGSEF